MEEFMNKKMMLSSLVIANILFSGCASIVKGSKQNVSIISNVKDAEIIVNGSTIGKTPYNGSIVKSSSTTITLQKEGYEPKTITLDTEVEPIFWGNILIGGVFGSTTDMASGAMYKYTPATLNIDLDKIQGN